MALPLDLTIEHALRGTLDSEDEATTEMLKSRVFYARRAANEARWAVAHQSPRDEAIRVALQAMCEAIPLPQDNQAQVSQTMTEQGQQQTEDQDQDVRLPLAKLSSESETSRSWMLSENTEQAYVNDFSRLSDVQQTSGAPRNVQPRSSQPLQTFRSWAAHQSIIPHPRYAQTQRALPDAFPLSTYSQQKRQPTRYPNQEMSEKQQSGITSVKQERAQEDVQKPSLALQHLTPNTRMPGSDRPWPSQHSRPGNCYSPAMSMRQTLPFDDNVALKEEAHETAAADAPDGIFQA
ncbi:hypothetical protein OHC33_000825 [Knufia fluminis]|uniref:Uncharacterized protein n=1 Tax=Knufia fluminis TaxID=191047 RepID=A0AAN8IRZ6_9EURO|nr:hypothetical protein OHC33_000825 [Knufia fluminis]